MTVVYLAATVVAHLIVIWAAFWIGRIIGQGDALHERIRAVSEDRL
jgi:hypothetical protein